MSLFEDIGYLLSHYFDFFLKGMASTILLSIVGTFGGLFFGIFIALGKGLKINKDLPFWKKPLFCLAKWLSTIYSTVIRGTPMMVQAMIFKYSCQALGVNWNVILHGFDVFNGWLVAGLIVITFNTAAYMGEIVRAGLNGIDRGQYEGARSLGMTAAQANFYIVFPQALRNALPTIANEWIVNIKDSSVLNVIGVTELFLQGQQAAAKGYCFIAAYLIVAVIYLVLTLIVSGLIKTLERKMDGKPVFSPLLHFRERRAAE